MSSVLSIMTARAALNSITVNTSALRVMAFEGDSRTGVSGCFPFIYGPNSSPTVLGINNAVSGSTIANLVSRVAFMTQIVASKVPGQKFYAVIGPMGANDLSGYAGATDAIAAQNYANAMGAYTDSLIAAGFDGVALCTELPTGDSIHNARRNLLNPIYTGSTSWRTNAVTIIDIAADSIMGPDNSFAVNPTYWTDATHPNATGQARLENQAGIRAALNALA